MEFDYILFKILPRLEKKFRQNLDPEAVLLTRDYITSFCSAFRDSTIELKAEHINEDVLYASVFVMPIGVSVYLTREFSVEGISETFQLKCSLWLNPLVQPEGLRISQSLYRDILGDFYTEDSSYIHFSDFMQQLLEAIPQDVLQFAPTQTEITCTYDH